MNKNYEIISVNGDFLKKKDAHLPFDNRAFRYGDGLFETMHANGQKVQFLNDHYQRLRQGAEILNLELPRDFSLNYLEQHLSALLNRCKLYQGVKIRVFVIRKNGGLYLPENNSSDIIIEAEYLSKGTYFLNEKGWVVGIFSDFVKPESPLFNFKSLNALPYVLCGIFAKKNSFDDALLINKNKQIVEASSSNIFCIKDKIIYTPALVSGCVAGVMRKNLIQILRKEGFEVVEKEALASDELLSMDEVFLTNAIAGIRWVSGIDNRRFYKKYTPKILGFLNQNAFEQN